MTASELITLVQMTHSVRTKAEDWYIIQAHTEQLHYYDLTGREPTSLRYLDQETRYDEHPPLFVNLEDGLFGWYGTYEVEGVKGWVSITWLYVTWPYVTWPAPGFPDEVYFVGIGRPSSPPDWAAGDDDDDEREELATERASDLLHVLSRSDRVTPEQWEVTELADIYDWLMEGDGWEEQSAEEWVDEWLEFVQPSIDELRLLREEE